MGPERTQVSPEHYIPKTNRKQREHELDCSSVIKRPRAGGKIVLLYRDSHDVKEVDIFTVSRLACGMAGT